MNNDITIIPAVLSKDWDEIKQKITAAVGVTDWFQIDIADNTMEPNETWRNPDDLKELHADIKIEMHLMVADPWRVVDAWIDAGAARIVTHIEAFDDHKAVDQFLNRVHDAGREAGLSLHPDTSTDRVVPFLANLDTLMFLGVEPGFSGQPFVPEVVENVKEFHNQHPEVVIEVDGGMNPERAAMMVDAGADIIISASSLFGYNTLEEGLAAFRDAIERGEQ